MSELRVGLDYWLAATHAPGIGRYLRELTRALAALPEPGAPRLALLDVGPVGEHVPEEALGLPRDSARVLRRRLRIRRGWLTLAERLAFARAETWLGPLDVFHRARALGAPRARVPQVLALAEAPRPDEREALGRLAAVLVFSEFARRELVSRHGLDEARVHRVPVGADHWRRDVRDPRAQATPPPPPTERATRRILVVGAVRAGRGHAAILEAFGALRGAGAELDLVIAGRRGDAAARLESALRSSPFRRDARWIDEPVESAMPALAASADVLVHLDREAWTAVTPLEALSFGAAVVASRLPAFEEALGAEAVFVEGDPDAPAGLVAALERALASAADPVARARRTALAAGFTWRANASATLEVYGRVANSPRQDA